LEFKQRSTFLGDEDAQTTVTRKNNTHIEIMIKANSQLTYRYGEATSDISFPGVSTAL
jgi:hypothetical protein